jgi:hypothetical protein
MRALSATLLAAAACLGAAQLPGVTLVNPVKPTLNAPAPPSVDFVAPPANVSLNSRDVPIQIGFTGMPAGTEVSVVSLIGWEKRAGTGRVGLEGLAGR